METKMKAENRALGPHIQEWPSGPPGGATGKTRLLSRKVIPQSLHGKDRPGARPSATPCIHPPAQSTLCARARCWNTGPVFLEPTAQQQKHTGPLSIGLVEGSPGKRGTLPMEMAPELVCTGLGAHTAGSEGTEGIAYAHPW